MMKHILLTTIAAVVLVGCGPQPPDLNIYAAAFNGNTAAVKQHIAAGADINAKNEAGFTPLINSAYKGHKKIAELLISEDANVNSENNDGQSPLYLAASEGHKDIVELLLNEGADINHKDNRLKDTPLHRAIYGGYEDVANLIIERGADINVAGEDGTTPLHYAVIAFYSTVELLIEKGANINARIVSGTHIGKTPLDITKHPDFKNDDYIAETADLIRKHGGKTGEELKAEEK